MFQFRIFWSLSMFLLPPRDNLPEADTKGLQLPVGRAWIDTVHSPLSSISIQQQQDFSSGLLSQYYPGPLFLNVSVRIGTGV